MTPHIEASKGDYAPIVLMPGDPLRAKWIAETFLDNVKQVNSVRNCLGYTGTYRRQLNQDLKVSVQASGMGQASLGIYVHELYNMYNVEKIVRVGSCGAISTKVNIGDIVVAMTASTDNAMTKDLLPGFTFCPCADYEMLDSFVKKLDHKIKYHVGSIVSNDYFYHPNPDWWKPVKEVGILAVEMEAHVLYSLANRFGKKALAVSTVSDHLSKDTKAMTPKERETSFNDMIQNVLLSV